MSDWRAVIEGRMRDAGLSTRKREVVWHVLAGLTIKEIADALFISVRTVKNHLWQIYDKLNLQEVQGSSGRIQLAFYLLDIDIRPLRTDLETERVRLCTLPISSSSVRS